MNIVADENVESVIVEVLRSVGHTVLYIAEEPDMSGDADDTVLEIARQSNDAVLLTNDTDFGALIFRDHLEPPAHGIVLMRFDPATALNARASDMVQFFAVFDTLHGPQFISIHSLSDIRIRLLPTP